MSFKYKVVNGKKLYYSYDHWVEVIPPKKNKKTYLTKILEVLTTDPLHWYEFVKPIQDNWDEPTIFKEEFITKAIIKGINQNKIEKIENNLSKNKYKGHLYKLVSVCK